MQLSVACLPFCLYSVCDDHHVAGAESFRNVLAVVQARNLTWQQFDWLMSGIDIEQPTAIRLKRP